MTYWTAGAAFTARRLYIRKDTENPFLRNVMSLGEVADEPRSNTPHDLNHIGPFAALTTTKLIVVSWESSPHRLFRREMFEMVGGWSNERRYIVSSDKPRCVGALVGGGIPTASLSAAKPCTYNLNTHYTMPNYALKACEGYDGGPADGLVYDDGSHRALAPGPL